MKKERAHRKWLLLIPLVILIPAGVCLFRFFNVEYVVYSGQWTYTTSDDQETYLIRWPSVYMVPFTPSYEINMLRLPLIPEAVEVFASDGNVFVSACMKRYHGHSDLDHSLKVADDRIVVTYMGYGKLDDGSIETIDEVKVYPLFPFEDQSAGQWVPSGYPWDEEVALLFQDPDQVVDPFYTEAADGAMN